MSKLYQDNDVSLEFHGTCYFVMAKDTCQIMLKGTLKDGLYHLEGVAVKSVGELENNEGRKRQFQHINNNASILMLSKTTNSSVVASKTVGHRCV